MVFFLGQDFAMCTISVEMVESCVCFVFKSQQIQNVQLKGVPYNKLLIFF